MTTETPRTMPLAALRTSKHLSQKEVAKRLGVVPETVARWEKNSGKMPSQYLVQLSDIYDWPIGLIFLG